MEVSGQLHTVAALSSKKVPLAPIGEKAGLEAVEKRRIHCLFRGSKP
jgi:hypothetical protein